MKRNTIILGVLITASSIIISCKSTAETLNVKRGGERKSISTIFSEMDANNDEKLSKDEVKGPLAKDFSKIDVNNDGFISKTELENAPKPERRERPRN
jgi:Ca2+-binding EF-hand superfamily protein